MADIDRLSRRVPVPVQGRARQGRCASGGRPSRRRHHGDPGRARPRRADRHDAADRARADAGARRSTAGTSSRTHERGGRAILPRRARRRADADRLQPEPPLGRARYRPRARRDPLGRASPSRKDGGPRRAVRQSRAGRLHREDRGVDESILKFSGTARVFESQDAAVAGILGGEVKPGDVVVIRYEGPQRRPGHAGDALSDELSEIEGPRQGLRADHRRALFGRHLGPVDRPCLARSGRRRPDRAGRRRRSDRDRHPQPRHPARRRRRAARDARAAMVERGRRLGSRGRKRAVSPACAPMRR